MCLWGWVCACMDQSSRADRFTGAAICHVSAFDRLARWPFYTGTMQRSKATALFFEALVETNNYNHYCDRLKERLRGNVFFHSGRTRGSKSSGRGKKFNSCRDIKVPGSIYMRTFRFFRSPDVFQPQDCLKSYAQLGGEFFRTETVLCCSHWNRCALVHIKHRANARQLIFLKGFSSPPACLISDSLEVEK